MDPVSVALGFVAGLLIAVVFFSVWVRAKFVSRESHDALAKVHQETRVALRVAEEQCQQQAGMAESTRLRAAEKERELAEWMMRTASLESSLSALQDRWKEVEGKLSDEQQLNREQRNQLLEHQRDLAHLEATHTALRNHMAEQAQHLARLQEQNRLEFEQLAQRIFTEKTDQFSRLSKTQMETVLKPLSENLEGFKKKVEETYDKESRERFTLEARVKDLIDHTQRISQEANNLTAALKGQTKKQGDWGETILERILEQSGLEKNREYFIQETLTSEDGQTFRPDVVVQLPDNRNIVIDSKVSLNAYLRYSEADIPEVQELALAQHLQALRTHVDQLSAKRYETLTDTLDFVILFVPVEPAYLLAIQRDSDLWAYAYARRVLLISPTNLIAVLKIVADLWKREMQNRNALEIARQGERLYDKFLGFIDSLEEVGRNLRRSEEAYDKAMKQLRDGRGNLAGQALKLRDLGIKSEKKLPASLRQLDEGDADPESEPGEDQSIRD